MKAVEREHGDPAPRLGEAAGDQVADLREDRLVEAEAAVESSLAATGAESIPDPSPLRIRLRLGRRRRRLHAGCGRKGRRRRDGGEHGGNAREARTAATSGKQGRRR
uniref:Uncharacterized protein n=1 Tax=Arundo donax TaxID=35708 RepID=A0A0A9C6U4_ARUDO